METIELSCYFTREKLIKWLLMEEDNPFTCEDDYGFFDDNQVIQEAGECGYIQGVNKDKYYCFDNGKIIEQKRLNEYI